MFSSITDIFLLNTEGGRAKLVEKLEFAEQALVGLDVLYVEDFPELENLREVRASIGKVIAVVSLPDTVLKNYEAARMITRAANDLRGNISDDPQRAALAFGKLFKGLSSFVEYLPPPLNMLAEMFADLEYFFETIRQQRHPNVHMREPGALELVDNL